MSNYFYLKADSSSNYRTEIEKTFILNAHTLTFYLCGLTMAAFFSPIGSASLLGFRRYLISLPFW